MRPRAVRHSALRPACDGHPGLPPERLVALGLLAGPEADGVTVLHAVDPSAAARHLDELERAYGPVKVLPLDAERHRDRTRARLAVPLAQHAEQRRPAGRSCRSVRLRTIGRGAIAAAALVLLGLIAWPTAALAALVGGAALASALASSLKLAALIASLPASLRAPRRAAGSAGAAGNVPTDGGPAPRTDLATAPVVTLLVALYREGGVVAPLIDRLGRLDYPRDRLDVILVTEDDDAETAAALTAAPHPPWLRVLSLPPTTLRTKPRALNYALAFARGSIIGIYDAEDDPDSGQVRAAAAAFAQAPPDVVCLQGALDVANDGESWITRAFALDYAGWFRVVLPGLARLGLVLPLGGTTLFLRRSAIDALGGWDAHNVTEDADLGLWIARLGGRTAILPATTREEATATPRAWVRQRSRWIKGYAVTCAAHLRDPARLRRDLGWVRLAGVLGLMALPLAQVTLAPALWVLWSEALGIGARSVPGWLVAGATVAGLAGLAVDLAIAGLGAARSGQPGRMAWLPFLLPYQAMATIAAWRAWGQLALAPYRWDKTAHGTARRMAQKRAAVRPGRQSSAPNPVAERAASSLSRVTNAREIWSRKAA